MNATVVLTFYCFSETENIVKMQFAVPKWNYKKIAIIGCGTFIFGILFTYVIFPPILKQMLIRQVWLKRGSQMRLMYDEMPFPLLFKVFVFNVTNKEEVQNGGKPALQEIGPFVFEVWKDRKTEQFENEVEDTLEYKLRNTFKFNRELSNGLTGDEIITFPHLLLILMSLTVNVDRAGLLPLIQNGIQEIFHRPSDAFWTGKVIDILFSGIDVDCTSNDFNVKAICATFESGEISTVTKSNTDGYFKFSIFGYLNATLVGPYKVYRGIKNIKDLGRIITYEHETSMDIWEGDECNRIIGTDATIFPPFLDKNDGLWVFEYTICRSMQAQYERRSSYRGLPSVRFSATLGSIRENKSLHCFCHDPEDIDTCPIDGTMNLFECLKAPLVASMPHFYAADPSLLNNVKSGLSPSKEKHEIQLDFEIISGSPLSAAKRVQFNIDLVPLEEIEVMKNLRKMIFPFLWIEEGVDLQTKYVNMLKYQLFLGLKLKAIVKYLCLVCGSVIGIIATILHFTKFGQQAATPVIVLQNPTGSNNNNINNNENEPPDSPININDLNSINENVMAMNRKNARY